MIGCADDILVIRNLVARFRRDHDVGNRTHAGKRVLRALKMCDATVCVILCLCELVYPPR